MNGFEPILAYEGVFTRSVFRTVFDDSAYTLCTGTICSCPEHLGTVCARHCIGDLGFGNARNHLF